MIYNYLRTFLRVLRKNWVSTSINIFGLSIGMVSAFLIAKYIGYSLIFDSSYVNRDRIYHVSQIETNNTNITYDGSATYRGITVTALGEIPEVQGFTKFNWSVERLVLVGNEGQELKSFNQRGIFSVDTSFTNIFNLTPIVGGLKGALNQPYSIIITRSIAEKYFDNVNSLGRSVRARTSWGEEHTWTVTCVVEDPPISSTLQFNILVSTLDNTTDLWQTPVYNQYMILGPGEDHEVVAEKISKAINDLQVFRGEDRSIAVILDPIEPELSKFEIFLISTGALIMILSWVSFSNLSVVQFMLRQREVFIRKSIGADNPMLMRQFLFETGSIILFSVLVSLMILLLAGGYFSELADGHLLPISNNKFYLNTMFLVIFVIGALLPSTFFLGTLIAGSKSTILREGKYKVKSRIRKRKVLAGFQFGIAILMISFTYVIDLQMKYLSGLGKGVNLENKIIIKPPKDSFQGKGRRARALRNELSGLPWINSVSSSSTIPGQAYRQEVNFSLFGAEQEILMYVNDVNGEFLPTYEIEILAGNNFPEQGGPANRNKVLINEVSMRSLGLDLSDAVGQRLVDENQKIYNVIGVVQDYHKTSPRDKIGPMIFKYNPIRGYFTAQYAAKTDPGKEEYAQLEAIWRQVYSELPFEYFLLSSYYEFQFNNEGQLLNMMRVFTFVSIFLACFSLIGLSIYEAANSKLEVGVRKTFGASSFMIFFLFMKKYMMLFMLIIIVLAPVIYYLSGQWLNEFSYRIKISPMHILIPAAGLLLIILSTIGIQITKLSRVDPIRTLREN